MALVSLAPCSRLSNVLTHAPLCRFARNQLGLQHQSLWFWGHFRIQNAQRYSGSFFSDFPAVLIDAGEWDTKRVIVVEISATHDRQILWNPNSVIQCIVHGAHCQRIIETK